jgi:hypothetical protein
MLGMSRDADEAAPRPEAQEPPALPGEVRRGSWDGATWAIDGDQRVHVWWPPAGLAWDAHPPSGSEIMRALRAAFVAERARAERAEQGNANLRQTLDDRGDAIDRAEALADRLAAEGDAMRNTALLALAEETDPAAALRAILAVSRACRTCGRVVEPVRQCYAVPTCYACLPPPPPLPEVKL